MRKIIFVAAVLSIISSIMLHANPVAPHWGLVTMQGPTRAWHQIVYWPERNSVILFGGITGQGLLPDDLREFHDLQWQPLEVPPGPSGRINFGMVYDTLHHNIVMFGGDNGWHSRYFSDTWLLTDSGWTQLNIQGPSPRAQFAMTYDKFRNKTVLFGGTDGQFFYGETWEFDGASWALREDATGPSPRMFSAMTYDPIWQKCVLFGGRQGGDVMPLMNDTWLYDGYWTELPASAPTARLGHVLGYDNFFQSTLLYGGDDTTQVDGYLDDTWWLNYYFEDWVNVDYLEPPARAFASMTSNDSLNQLVLFGGIDGYHIFSDVWVWPVFDEYTYIPGDVNGSRNANGIDVAYFVNYLKGGTVPPQDLHDECPLQPNPFYAACDVNGNCVVNGIDVTFFVRFLKGTEPSLRFCPDCPPSP